MLYLVDSLNTFLGYGETYMMVEAIDYDLAILDLANADYVAALHESSIEKLRKDLKIIDLINNNPDFYSPDLKENDILYLYDFLKNVFYEVRVLPKR